MELARATVNLKFLQRLLYVRLFPRKTRTMPGLVLFSLQFRGSDLSGRLYFVTVSIRPPVLPKQSLILMPKHTEASRTCAAFWWALVTFNKPR